MENVAALLFAIANWFIAIKPSLPDLYYNVSSKRGIPIKKFRYLEKRGLKATKLRLDVQYLETCLNMGLYPPMYRVKDTKVNTPVLNNKVEKVIIQNTLANARCDLEDAKSHYKAVLKEITDNISLMERICLNALLSRRYSKEVKDVHERHQKKLFNLWSKQSKFSPDCIRDISSRGLSIQERNALQFGLQHHIIPKSFDRTKVKVYIEEAIDSLLWKTSETHVDFDLRDNIKKCYFDYERQGEKVCSSKKNQFLHKTLRNLARDKTICVCPYDKGTGVVIMDSSDYYSKLNEIVNDTSKFIMVDVDHTRPKTHPVVKKQNSVRYYVTKYIPEEDRKGLIKPGSQPGKLYGLCKVHKENFPMRPIVSMVNTPEYNLAKYLDNFIKPNIPDNFMLKSTNDFLSRIKSFALNGTEQMVSYDVVSLFTNVPLEETIGIVTDYVYGESSVCRPPFDEDTFCKLLRLCSKSYFMFNDVLYQQIDGVSMGGPLAPSLANAFLSHLENTVLTQKLNATCNITNVKPRLFLRYVDDVFALFNSAKEADVFLNILNSLHPSITFTLEKGNTCMPFLDVVVSIDCNMFTTTVYRKKTHTGVFLNYLATAPTVWKKSVISCLLYRAKMICSSVSLFDDEVSALKDMFMRNAYPESFFNCVLCTFLKRYNSSDVSVVSDVDEDELPTVILRVPYISKYSIKFARSISTIISTNFPVKVNIVYTTFKVKSYFCLKCFSPAYLSSYVVYHFKGVSDSCPDNYVGYTIRHLFARAGEHLNLKTKQSSEIKDHIRHCTTGCKNATYKDFEILRRCRSETHCKLFEAFAIKKLRPSLNKQLFAQGASKILHIWK